MYIVVLKVTRPGVKSGSRQLMHNNKVDDYLLALDWAQEMAIEHSQDINLETPVPVTDGFMFMTLNFIRYTYSVEKLEETK